MTVLRAGDGVLYSAVVQVARLAGPLLAEFTAARSARLQPTLCSGAQAASNKVNRRKPGPTPAPSIKSRPGLKYGMFVASSCSQAEEKAELQAATPPDPSNLPGQLCESFEGFQNSPNKVESDKVPPCQPSSDFIGFCNSVILGSRPPVQQQQQQQWGGFQPQYKRKLQQYGSSHSLHHEAGLKGSVDQQPAGPPSARSHLQLDRTFPHNRFVVLTLAYTSDEQACNVLQRSSALSRIPVSWQYTSAGPGRSKCLVLVGGQQLAAAEAINKSEARDNATSCALALLRKHCYTIEMKSKFLGDGTEVDLMDVEVNTEVGGAAEALGASNLGHKLLSMMGWKGGGLGAGGAGRAEPITATTVFGREGLGSRNVGKNFKQKITKIVQEWMSSNSPYDLVFTTGFDTEQRKTMHEVARRFGLKSKSFGKNDDRRLTISKKIDGLTLVEELLRRGGEDDKYLLHPPGGRDR